MSRRLSHSQHDHLLKAIEDVHACRSIDEFPSTVSGVFRSLIGCDSVSYNEVYPSIERSVAVMSPLLDDLETWLAKWKQYADEHPVIRYARTTGDCSAHQISDFLSRRQYHALDLYQQIYREMNVEEQMAVSVSAPMGIIVGVALNRDRHRFSETARLLANHLRPHLSRGYLNLMELQHLNALVDGLSGALEDSGAPVVLWSHREIVLHASGQARDIMERYFGWRGGRHLPEKIAQWARARLTLRHAPETMTEKSLHGELTVRLAPRPEFHYTTLLLEEESVERDASKFRALGLSRRQSEVMAWLAEGKSNGEIAVILGMNPLTVKTHVRDILRRLGVENRTTAAARALESLTPPRR